MKSAFTTRSQYRLPKPMGWLWYVPGLLLLCQLASAQGFFTPIALSQARAAAPSLPPVPNAKAYNLSETAFRTYLTRAPSAAITAGLRLSLPLPDGTSEVFLIHQTQTLSPELAAENPSFKTYAGTGEAHPAYTLRMSLTSLGFEAVIWGVGGDAVYFVKTSTDRAASQYLSYFARDYRKIAQGRAFGAQLGCGSVASAADRPALFGLTPRAQKGRESAPTSLSAGSTMRTFRMAIATTGEWTRNAGGYPNVTDTLELRTNALGKIVAALNRINGIFGRELATQFVLVNPSVKSDKNLQFDNPATDSYDNTDKPAQLDSNQLVIDRRVGQSNYDIGHLFGTTGGGVAKFGLCDNRIKAQGYSARELFLGDPFVVDYVAHEIGHQFGMNHTYNVKDKDGACTTREASMAFEVASGSTIMSYVGICNEGRNLQQYVDGNVPSFHIASLHESSVFVASEAVGCGSSAGKNTIPTVTAGNSYAIPRLTPFQLTARGADADSADVPKLLYSWEQTDLAPSASGALGKPTDSFDIDDDSIARPLFRAYTPIASPQRSFPSLAFILNPQANAVPGENQPGLTYTGTHPTAAPGATCPTGSTCLIGERLPTMARVLTFRVAVRDQRGGVADSPLSLTVVNTPGAFRLTSFDTASAVAAGTDQKVTWNVVGTDKSPINCANVRLSLSTDGGLTFPTTLLTSTPNSGSAVVRFPNVPTEQARVKVEAVGNVFFDISNANLTITAGTSQTLGTVAVSTSACAGGTAMASVSAVGGTAPYSYTWNAPTGLTFIGTSSTTLLSTVSSRTTGVQTLTLTVTDALNTTAITTTQVSLSVAPAPTLSLTALPGSRISTTTSLTLLASGALRYRWNTRDTTASISPLTSVTGTYPYSVTGTTANGCSSVASLSVVVRNPGDTTVIGGSVPGLVAVNSVDSFGVRVLGNPSADETVEIEVSGLTAKALTLRVLTAQGQLVQQQTVEHTDPVVRKRLRLGASPGVYLIQVVTPAQSRTVKVSKL